MANQKRNQTANHKTNGKSQHRTSHKPTPHIEPVLRMIAAFTSEEQAAVKYALDKAAYEKQLLESAMSGQKVQFSLEEIADMQTMSSEKLLAFLDEKQ
jgi:phage-related protein